MTNFFQRPLIPLQPNPEPEEFPLYRDMQFRRIADLQADPYGGQKFSNMGRGTFDPRSGGYGPSNAGRPAGGAPGQGGGQGGFDIGRLLQMLARMGAGRGATDQGGGMKTPMPVERSQPTGADAEPGLPGPYESNFPASTVFSAAASPGANAGGSGGSGGGMPMRRRRPLMAGRGYDAGQTEVLPGRPGMGGWRDIPTMEGGFDPYSPTAGYGPDKPNSNANPMTPRRTNPGTPQPTDPRFSSFLAMNGGNHGATGTTPHYTDPNNPFGNYGGAPRGGTAAPAAAAAPVMAGHDAARRVMRGYGARGRC